MSTIQKLRKILPIVEKDLQQENTFQPKKSDWDVVCDKSPYPREENPVISKCQKCGLELRRTMWYCCSSPNCPSGLGSKATL